VQVEGKGDGEEKRGEEMEGDRVAYAWQNGRERERERERERMRVREGEEKRRKEGRRETQPREGECT
jgi:hypothetical protein